MKQRKLLLYIMALLMVFSLAALSACSSSSPATSKPPQSTEPTAPPEEEPVEEAFAPQGVEVTSKSGALSVLAPSDEYEMWEGIDWRVDLDYSDNSIYIRYVVSGSDRFYVRPAVWPFSGKYDTAELLEAALASGEYLEWSSSYGRIESVTVEGVELWDCTTDENPAPDAHHQYIVFKDGKTYGIQATCNKEEFREVYENLLKQVVLTMEY